jgi:hypothetical protein
MVLKDHDEPALHRSRHLHRDFKQGAEIDYQGLATYSVDGVEKSKIIRFGNIGSSVAIGQDQSQSLRLDRHDQSLYTCLMVIGDKSRLWKTDKNQGSLVLPTLGLIVPLHIGDMVFFTAAELPHFFIPLNSGERDRRTVVTTYTCANLAAALENPPTFCLPLPGHVQDQVV